MVLNQRILIAEDEFLTSLEIVENLELAGARAEMVATQREALERLDRIDGAIVDLLLSDGICLALVEELVVCKIPFFLVSGLVPEFVPRELKGLPQLAKPYLPTDLLEFAHRLFPGR